MGYSGDESCIAEGAEGGKFEFGVVQTLTGHHTLDVWIAEDSGVATSATSAPKIEGITIKASRIVLRCRKRGSSVETQSKQPMKKTLFAFALTFTAHAAPPEAFWKALHQVETSGRFGAIKGDGGAALGPLQIHRGFHADSRVPGPYERVADLAYARKVATAYYKRYAPGAWERGDVVALARIHQGGPRGHQKAATLPYARKVLAYTRR